MTAIRGRFVHWHRCVVTAPSKPTAWRSAIAATVIVLGLLTAVGVAQAQDADLFKNLKYRNIGPAAGGRVSRVAGVPGDPLTYYFAASASGVWKSTDGGVTWEPIFDEQPISSIGSIAVAPSDPNIIYVGSGEANIRSNVGAGNGIYKSTDAGKTWKHVWNQEGQIGTMIVHPANPDIAFAAVLGHVFGPNGERGVYRTKDGGKTWERVVHKNPDTGASDVCFDPSNPNILFAGLWQARRRPWELVSGGPGSGLYVSRDGGDTWKQLTGNGLPNGPWGKIGVAVAPSDGRRVYALIEADKGGLYRSDDGGENWQRASDSRAIRQRAWYYSTLTIDPKNPDVVWCPQVPMMKSIDGGKTFKAVRGFHHGDHHDLWIDPVNPKRMIDGNDGGVDISTNGGESWFAPPLPISQFYRINVDNRTPYYVSGTMQDIGAAAGPSNSLNSRGIGLGEWHTIGGGETGYTAHDPTDPNIIYAGEYGGYISRYDHRTRQARNISIYPYRFSGEAESLKYRFRWPAPLMLSPHDPKTLYHAGNVLFKTTDGGQTWTPISGDLTRNDKTKQKWSGGPITGDNTSAEHYCTISAIAESPKQKDLLWAGSDDGLVHVSQDGGKTWTNVTPNIPDLPEWATIKMIEPSRHDAGTAYVVVDAHMLDDMRPYLYKTTDFGKTWKSLSTKMPPDVYLHVVREDPKKKGLLFVGTERGVGYSTDDGENWQPLKLNLPTVAVHDLVVKDNDLVVGTNGRSIWILDDLAPIREMAPKVADAEFHLFPASDAIRWRYHGSVSSHAKAPGENPPPGAVLHYCLKRKPAGEVTLEILDPQGTVVRKRSSKPEPEEEAVDGDYAAADYSAAEKKPALPADPGLHRVTWDLCHAGASQIKRARMDSGDPTSGPMITPGTYTVKLTVDGKSITTPLVVKPDPRLNMPAADLDSQLKFTLTVRDDFNKLVQTVNQLKAVKQQLTSRNDLVRDDPKAEQLIKDSKALVEKLDALENKLHNPKARISYDILAEKGGARLYSKIGVLWEALKDADGAPTQGMQEVYAEHAKELGELEAEWNKLVGGDLGHLNELAKRLDLPHVIVPKK